jgi:hypothetical protein
MLTEVPIATEVMSEFISVPPDMLIPQFPDESDIVASLLQVEQLLRDNIPHLSPASRSRLVEWEMARVTWPVDELSQYCNMMDAFLNEQKALGVPAEQLLESFVELLLASRLLNMMHIRAIRYGAQQYTSGMGDSSNGGGSGSAVTAAAIVVDDADEDAAGVPTLTHVPTEPLLQVNNRVEKQQVAPLSTSTLSFSLSSALLDFITKSGRILTPMTPETPKQSKKSTPTKKRKTCSY